MFEITLSLVIGVLVGIACHILSAPDWASFGFAVVTSLVLAKDHIA